MKLAVFISLALLFVGLSSCQNKSNSSSSDCTNNPSMCANSSLYQQNTGYTGYGYGNNSNPFNYYGNTAYLCNCPYGTMPTYNGSAGLGCVSTNYYNQGFGFYGYIHLGWNNNQWSNMSGLNSFYPPNNPYSSCYNGAVQSCVMGQANTCPAGTFCLDNSGQSSLGLCVTDYR
ncbi:MAG: hypothetical protein ACXVAX_02645 [Pseudobdellovibrio sp.]